MSNNKERLVTLALKDQDSLNTTVYTMDFKTRLSDDEILPAIKAAAQDYLNTPEGRKTWKNNGQCFNYRDFNQYVGNQFCIPQGFICVKHAIEAIKDDFNTQLASLDNDSHNNTPFAIIDLGFTDSNVLVTNEDADDIMESVMTGCTYWCKKVEPVDSYLGEYASEQISRGGTLKFHQIDDTPVDLTPKKFKNGLSIWLKYHVRHSSRIVIQNDRIDPGQIDANDADSILQYALFGRLIYV